MRPLGWTVTSMKKSILMRAKVQKVKLTEVFQNTSFSILLENESEYSPKSNTQLSCGCVLARSGERERLLQGDEQEFGSQIWP